MVIPVPDQQAIAACVQRIGRYLHANPLACDSVDGIQRWWLAGSVDDQATVARALHWLEDAGLVAAVRAADGRVRYNRCGAHGDAQFLAAVQAARGRAEQSG